MKPIVSIQALRAVAAIAVAIIHFSIVAQIMNGTANQVSPLLPLSAGVDLFFVISGFVMVYSSEMLFAAPRAAATFLLRRLARIVPLYWAVTLIAIPLLPLAFDAHTLAASALFLPYRAASGQIVPLYGPGWTLNYEMTFYVVFASCLAWPRRAAVPIVAAFLIVAVILGQLVKPQFAPLAFWSEPIILEFVFGMAIAMAFRAGFALPAAARLVLITAGSITIWLPPPMMMLSDTRVLVFGVPMALICAGVVLGKRQFSPSPFTGLVKLVGDASYSIYLLHPLVANLIFRLWPRGHAMWSFIFALCIGLIATVPLCALVYRYLERPTTRFLAAFLTRWLDPAASPVILPAG